ncbi:MAG: DMT family transporter [Bdellovibrionota bacterium]
MRTGSAWMLLAATLFAAMGALAFYAHALQPSLSPMVSTTVRVLMNVLFTLAWALRTQRAVLPRPSQLYVWGFGLFGAVTISTHFASLRLIGNGETSFLQAIQGIVIAALSPWVLKQRNEGFTWGWLLLSLIGLALLLQPDAKTQWWGVILGLLSGTAAAGAYLCIAKQGERVSILQTMGTWSACSLLLMLVLVPGAPTAWPSSFLVWCLLLAAGGLAAVGQYAAAVAFSRGPATQVAIVGYTGPVIAYSLDWLFFEKIVNGYIVVGAALIIGCSIAARGFHFRIKSALSRVVP